MRPPVIVGLTPGAGASTLAAALHAHDGGPLVPRTAREADIVVVRGDPVGLRRLAAVACAPEGPPPVLAVVAAPRHRIALPPSTVARFSGVAVLPWVSTWSGRPGPPAVAPDVLALRDDQLPGPLPAYAAALRRLVAAVIGAGLLVRSTPPQVALPRAPALWRGLRPVDLPRTPTVDPLPTVGPRELDDDALEAEHLRPATGCPR